MKGRQKKLLLLTVPFIVFLFLVKVGTNRASKDSEYYKAVGLKLKGKITKVKPLQYGHDYGVISVDIDESNKKEYDKRTQLKRYLGVIKNQKANLVFNRVSSIQVGDSIVLDIQDYKLYRNKRLIEEGRIGMPPSNFIDSPFREIKQKVGL